MLDLRSLKLPEVVLLGDMNICGGSFEEQRV
jgi:hypothetical protein